MYAQAPSPSQSSTCVECRVESSRVPGRVGHRVSTIEETPEKTRARCLPELSASDPQLMPGRAACSVHRGPLCIFSSWTGLVLMELRRITHSLSIRPDRRPGRFLGRSSSRKRRRRCVRCPKSTAAGRGPCFSLPPSRPRRRRPGLPRTAASFPQQDRDRDHWHCNTTPPSQPDWS
jgi:hypothetical protein